MVDPSFTLSYVLMQKAALSVRQRRAGLRSHTYSYVNFSAQSFSFLSAMPARIGAPESERFGINEVRACVEVGCLEAVGSCWKIRHR